MNITIFHGFIHIKKTTTTLSNFEHQAETLAKVTYLYSLAHNFEHTLIVSFMISRTKTYSHSKQKHHTYINLPANIPTYESLEASDKDMQRGK